MTNLEELKQILDKFHSDNAVPEFPDHPEGPTESKIPVSGIEVERYNMPFDVKFIDTKCKKYLNTETNQIIDINQYNLVCDATNGSFKNFQINLDELESFDVESVLNYIKNNYPEYN